MTPLEDRIIYDSYKQFCIETKDVFFFSIIRNRAKVQGERAIKMFSDCLNDWELELMRAVCRHIEREYKHN